MMILKQISKAYDREKIILQDIDFHIARGKIVAIIGPNGCGKTTLLHIIAGLDDATSGAIEIVDGTNHRDVQFGLISQDPRISLFPWKTVGQNVEFVLKHKKLDRSTLKKKSEKILQTLGLWEHRDKYPYELSGGMAQLVVFGRNWALDPDMFLLDEPFSALDYHTSLKTQFKFLDIWEETRKPVVLVTHSVDEALLLADVIVILSNTPTRIIKIFQHDLPRPRSLTQLNTSICIDLKEKILIHLESFVYD